MLEPARFQLWMESLDAINLCLSLIQNAAGSSIGSTRTTSSSLVAHIHTQSNFDPSTVTKSYLPVSISL